MRPRATSPEAVLIEVLDRVAGSRDHTTRISARELAGWPVDAVAALKSQRLLRRSRPATSVVCPGCEQQCGMPVYTVVGPGASAGQTDRWSFIVCDKRDDINRVTVEPDRLTQWQSDPDAVCDFVADCLGLRPRRETHRPGRADGNRHGQRPEAPPDAVPPRRPGIGTGGGGRRPRPGRGGRIQPRPLRIEEGPAPPARRHLRHGRRPLHAEPGRVGRPQAGHPPGIKP